ncbi:ribonuclease HII [Neobacillus cucumis]|uniref:Ribonuclease HII n=1 Tax=Neobacillus cucumis TaxID=1740721 RepID=A0A2N5HLZ9_9BACI|nr:ribonuclease HII [Neobacillus cucumis]PLS06534.1 ribonuclease HII [Neobacillus cucumis]
MKRLSIAQIEEKLVEILEETDSFIVDLEKDERKGVQASLTKWKKQREQEKLLRAKFAEMNQYERKIRAQGFSFIAGVDEVGRGPLAGPVVAAAVILPEDFFLAGIDDSKKLTEKKREEFASFIKKEAMAYSVAMIPAEEIDEMNIYEATKKAMKAAVVSLEPKPDFLLIDAMKLETPYPTESIIKGDAKSISIAAASIVAKVARDELMKELSESYPVYGFQQNMGYGTKEHLQAIKQYGITPYHRKSFAPVKDYINIIK